MQSALQFVVTPTHEEVTNVEYHSSLNGRRSNKSAWSIWILDFKPANVVLEKEGARREILWLRVSMRYGDVDCVAHGVCTNATLLARCEDRPRR